MATKKRPAKKIDSRDVAVPRPVYRGVIARSRGVCVYCGARPESPEVDHVTPRRWFPVGTPATVVNAPTNLVCACVDCNDAKAKQDLEGFARMLRFQGYTKRSVDAMVDRVQDTLARPLPGVL